MNWHKVNLDNPDSSELPPMDQIVFICYLSDYDDSLVIELGGRGETEDVDDETMGWGWGVLDSKGFAKNWEPKLYGLEIDDDYRVVAWAEIEWPSVELVKAATGGGQ